LMKIQIICDINILQKSNDTRNMWSGI